MKISTLELIHRLLRDYEEGTLTLYREAARMDEKEAETKGTPQEDSDLTVMRRVEHMEALDALTDFEAKSF